MARAAGSAGRSTAGAGQRLEADEDVRQTGRVEPAAEPDGDLGRRRQDAGHGPDRGRTAGGLGQARDRSLGQQAARQPDDEQGLGDTEARPGGPVGGPEQAGPELAASARPIAAPIDSPRATAQTSPMSTTNGRRVGSSPLRRSARNGSARMARTPPPIAPIRPVTCGIAPDRQPRMRATTIRSSVMASIAFTRRSSHRPSGRAPGRLVRSGDGHADRVPRRRSRR